MRITDVKATYCEVPLLQGGYVGAGDPKRKRTHEAFTFVRVSTEDGIVGIGAQPMGMRFPEYAVHLERTMHRLLTERIVHVEAVEKLAGHIRAAPLGRELSPVASCVEIALWDALGKKAGLPIHQLFGKRCERIKAYASVAEEFPPWDTSQWVTFCGDILGKGFKAIKLHIGKAFSDPNDTLRVVEALRKTYGYDWALMIDCQHAWEHEPALNLESAIRLAKGCEDLGVAFLEEPMPHFLSPNRCAKLCEQVAIPIAGGGALHGSHNFRTLMREQVLDIVQPDVNYCGGISEIRRIAAAAETFGCTCEVHAWAPGIALAATLQAAAAIDAEWFEYTIHPPYWTPEVRDCMLSEPIRIDTDGMVAIPAGPGLGIEINEEVIKQYAVT